MTIQVSEILLILFVALLVIKPERLPGIAFTLGCYLKKWRRLIEKLKHEMNSHE